MQWHAMIDEMSHINAVAQSRDGDLYLCGDYQPNAATDEDEVFDGGNSANSYKAVLARINSDGELIGIVDISDENRNGDRCKGIYYDEDSGKITGLIQSRAGIIRYKERKDYATILFEMDNEGQITRADTIGLAGSKNSLYQARNGLLKAKNELFFAGWSQGDAKIYKYRMGDANGFYCLRPDLKKADKVAELTTLTSGEEAVEQGRYTRQDGLTPSTLLTGQEDSGLTTWVSNYAGAFALGSTIQFPRECMQSHNGRAYELDYPLGSPNGIYQMSKSSNWKNNMVKDFYSIGDIASFEQENLGDTFNGKIKAYTEDESLVGTSQFFFFRKCVRRNGIPDLYEWRLQVNVLENLPMLFTDWASDDVDLQFNEDGSIHFDMPFATEIYFNYKTVDPEGTDSGKVAPKPVPGREDEFYESKYQVDDWSCRKAYAHCDD